MAASLILRTDSGDEHLELIEFEARVRRGEISPQSLVCLPPITGDRFVPACELELFKALHEPKRASFSRTFSVTRFPYITSGLILLNLSIFLFTARGGEMDIDDMVRSGAKVGPLIWDLGELWRLFTANFLHHDGLHLGLNMFVLFNVGGALENTYRTLDYLWLLVFTGLATMTTSLLLNESITIGASGMVFGCLGGVVAFGLKYRSLLPTRYRSLMADAAVPVVLGLLMMGITSHGVDNWAHIGGLVAGIGTGALMRPRLLAEARRWWWEPALRAAPSLGILAVVFGGQTLFREVLPVMRLEHDDAYGLSMPVPKTWVRGANPLGSVAWYNGLSGLGRASFAAEAVDMPEGADAMAWANRFVDDRLAKGSLQQGSVRHQPPELARVADHDAVRVRAVLDDPAGNSRLVAYFVPRGNVVYQLVFLWPTAFPRYGQIVEQMLAGVKFDETRALRLARAETLLFPNSPAALARLGEELLNQGDGVPAAEALAGAVRGEPSSAEYRVLLSRAWLAAGEIERACEAAKAAVQYDGEDPEVLEADARCELARGNPQRALERIERALVAAPGDARLKAAQSRLRESLPR